MHKCKLTEDHLYISYSAVILLCTETQRMWNCGMHYQFKTLQPSTLLLSDLLIHRNLQRLKSLLEVMKRLYTCIYSLWENIT